MEYCGRLRCLVLSAPSKVSISFGVSEEHVGGSKENEPTRGRGGGACRLPWEVLKFYNLIIL